MVPVVLGAAGLAGLVWFFSRREGYGSSEAFGHHLPPGISGFSHVALEGDWDIYRFTGSHGSFYVAMFPDSSGRWPSPGRTNLEYFYPDGVSARAVRASGPDGRKWASVDISGEPFVADLFVYHPSRHPASEGGFPRAEMAYGSVSPWMGGRGPGAGTGLSAGGGGRHSTGLQYDWSGPVSSGGFRRWRNPDEDLQIPGGDRFGINILGFDIPLSKADRLEKLEGKIEAGTAKISELEASAKEPGADLERLAKQIASLEADIDRWEDKKNRIEVRMGEDDDSFGEEDFDGDVDMEDFSLF